MATPSNFEQLVFEYLNQARMDPKGEFDRFIKSSQPVQGLTSEITSALQFFDVNLKIYKKQLSELSGVAPLAWNAKLNEAATDYSKVMIKFDTQGHNVGGTTPGARVTAAGYTWNTVAENVFAFTKSPEQGHAGFFIDWGYTSTGIQDPPGHRNNIMSSAFSEVGIGVVKETKSSTQVGPFVMTQNMANRADYAAQFIGVVYTDKNSNGSYSMGEGRKKVKVTIRHNGGSSSATTWASGGYQKAGMAGINTLTFSGGGLARAVSARVSLGTDNVKVDLVDGKRIDSSVTTKLKAGARDLTLLGSFDINGIGNGLANKLTGNVGRNTLKGGRGRDTLAGGEGMDRLVGGGGRDRFSYANRNEGGDTIADFRKGKDKFQFASANFKGAKGKLKAKNFRSNNRGVAKDNDDYYVYSTKSATLFYDADGKGGSSRVKIATFSKKVDLKRTDILIT